MVSTISSHKLERMNSFKELGVILNPDMKHHEQVDAAVANARSAVFLIRRVRPVFQYCSQALAPTTLCDMSLDVLEVCQGRSLAQIAG